MKIIKLRLVSGTSVRVNPDYIQYYHGEAGTDESCTYLMLKDESLKVKETPKQIDAAIAELPTRKYPRSLFEEIFGPTGGSR